MIVSSSEVCPGCGVRVCSRCGQCHEVSCEEQVAICRPAFIQSRVGRTRVLHHRRAKQFGAHRRLRSA
jgi:hypothetical protein